MSDNIPDIAKMDDITYKKYFLEVTSVFVNPNIDKQAVPRLRDLRSDWEKHICTVDPEMTVDKLSKKHEIFKAEWEASDSYRTHTKIFENTVLQQNKLSITACMHLGLGSMNSGDRGRGPRACDRSMKQLVWFESLVNMLSESFAKREIL